MPVATVTDGQSWSETATQTASSHLKGLRRRKQEALDLDVFEPDVDSLDKEPAKKAREAAKKAKLQAGEGLKSEESSATKAAELLQEGSQIISGQKWSGSLLNG